MRFAFTFAALLYLSVAFFQDWFLRPTCHCTILGSPPATSHVDPKIIDNLKTHVAYLTKSVGPRFGGDSVALHQALKYVGGSWTAMGYRPIEGMPEITDGAPAALWVDRAGSSAMPETVIVTARYDSPKGSGAANQSASGAAALIELSRHFQASPLRRTVRFLALANPHPDGDSLLRVAHDTARDKEHIAAVISLGSLGYFSDAPDSQHFPAPQSWLYPTVGNFIQVLGFLNDEHSRGTVNVATQLFNDGSTIPVTCHKTWNTLRGAYLPETLAFHKAGLPAIQISDTGAYRYPYYDSALDTSDRIDFTRLQEVLNGIEKVIEGIANDPGPTSAPHIS